MPGQEEQLLKIQSMVEKDFEDPDRLGKIWIYWIVIPLNFVEDMIKPSQDLLNWLNPNQRRYGFDHLLMPPSVPIPTLEGLSASDEYISVLNNRREVSRLMKIYRNGTIAFGMDMRDNIIPGLSVSEYTILFLSLARDFLLTRAKYEGKVRIVFGMNKPQGTRLAFVSYPLSGQHPKFEDPTLKIVQDSDLTNPVAVAQSLLDKFFNGFHLVRCKFFDTNGKWIGKWNE